ncbi:MAG: SUMF1/EgtB/PvdO family nonheme iron enzyme [Anaerolineales bacterium]|nr:SUMF1/EgtB/PvdO family nonheme iron enzyme [Anaerolineales bacterium]
MSKKYALVIGNNQYDDPNWHDLKTPERDAEAIAAVLNDPQIGGFDRVQTLLNASVTQMRIAIAQLFIPSGHRPDDLLLLYFSGHGALNSSSNLYFVGKDTQHDDLLEATGLDATYITKRMDGARSRRQVIILDSCYSGAFGQLPKGAVPTEAIFEGDSQALFEQDKSTLEETGNGYGRHILAATEALQLAWEGDTLQGEIENSFFTQFLVEGLAKGLADRNNDGLIDIEELYDHIREGMRAGKQTPIKRSLHADGKLIIARSPISPFKRKEEQMTDLLVQAEKAMERDDYTKAETLLKNVIQAETNDLLAETAQAMLDDLQAERIRVRAYSNVKSLIKKGAARAARTAWKQFSVRYPNYDPNNLAAQLTTQKDNIISPPDPPKGGEKDPIPPSGGLGGQPSATNLMTLSPKDGEKDPIPPSGGLGGPTPATNLQPSLPREPKGAETLLPQPFAWVKIPAGQVTLIEEYFEKTYLPKGEAKVFKVEPFAIAKYPLTNAQFAPFIEAGGYKEKKWWTETGWDAREKGYAWDSEATQYKPTGKLWTEPRFWTDKQWNGAEQPVVGVSWYEAMAYCRWLSDKTGQTIILPPETQWQYAAQGDDRCEYPWGNEWDCKCCNNCVKPCNSNTTTPVTAYEGQGDSPFGVVDMAGNVWEWCLTQYYSGGNDLDGTDARVLRGGSWIVSHRNPFLVTYRDGYSPCGRIDRIGFRVALSL